MNRGELRRGETNSAQRRSA